MDPVVGDQRLVDRECDVLILARQHLDPPGVAADDNHLLRCEPHRRRIGDPGFAAVVGRILGRILLEQVTPAGVDEHRVTLAQGHVVQLQPGLQVCLGNQRAGVEAGVLAGGVGFQLVGGLEHLDRVDDDATRGEGLDVLEAEPLQIVLRDVFPHRRLVVVAVLDADMAHPVDMRADMALAEIGVLHIAQLVVAEFRTRHHGEAGQDGLAEAAAEQRYAVHEVEGHRRDDAGLDLGGGGLGDGGGNTVSRAGLVVRPEWRGRNERLAVGVGRGGHRLHH